MWTNILWVIAGLSTVQAVMLTVMQYESFRFTLSRLRARKRPRTPRYRSTAVIIPVSGNAEALRTNLQAFFGLDHPNYQILFSVETTDDPAVPVIDSLIRENSHVRARLVVAGTTTGSGQKIHNLLAAWKATSEDVEVLAFADADIQPQAEWLDCLVEHLGEDRNLATTGYRWFVPSRSTLINLYVSSINGLTTSLLGRHNWNLIWGGSWAVDRATFESADIAENWPGTLSDDVVATRSVNALNARIDFQPCCLSASAVDMDLKGALEFLNRQSMIVRMYSPGRWWSMIGFAALYEASYFCLASGVIYGILSDGKLSLIPLFALLFTWCLGGVRSWMRQTAARQSLPGECWRAGPAWFDFLFGQFLGVASLLLVVSSVLRHSMRWREFVYRMDRAGRIQSVARVTRSAA